MREIPGTITDRRTEALLRPSSREQVEQILEASTVKGLDEYQEIAASTAIYPENVRLTYPILGLANEAGEVAGKLKKLMRDEGFDGTNLTDEQRETLVAELGDVCWYLAATASDLGVSLSEIATKNADKLRSRKERGVLGGSGDNR